MQIVLSILQILGWTLLVLLIIILFLVGIILFHPVRYLIDVHWMEEKRAKIYAHWLFRLIHVKVSYADDLLYGETSIFGKKKIFSYDFTDKKDDEPQKETEKVVKDKTEDKGIISKIKGMIERIKEIYPRIKKIINDDQNKEAIIHFKNECIYLIKVLLPKKSKIDVVFSTGSTDTTGQTFGVLACFPAIYQKNWKIIPDFQSDEMYFKGILLGKGRLYGYELIGIILRILFDKNCRRLYTIINRFIKWMKKDDNKSEDNRNG